MTNTIDILVMDPPVIASFLCACAREAGYGDLLFSTWKMLILRTMPE